MPRTLHPGQGSQLDIDADEIADPEGNDPYPAPASPGGAAEAGTVVVTPPNEVDIGAALDAAMVMSGVPPSVDNWFPTAADIVFSVIVGVDPDAGGTALTNLADPADPQDAATKNYVDELAPARPLAAVLAEGNDTGGTEIVHAPAVNVAAFTSRVATATGTGNAKSADQATTVNGEARTGSLAEATGSGDAWSRALAKVVDGNATAGPRAESTGTGDPTSIADACTYARSVDGDALADNDAAASGTGDSDAGCYAAAVDGTANAAGYATTTGTGVATAGATATGTGGTAGMIAVADAVSGRMGFNGVTPIARPEVPATPDAQDIADVLVALGLVTQAA